MNNTFDPDATGVANGAYFGFPFSLENAALALISVPWDATVSYGEGTAAGPAAMIEASTQIEIYDADFDADLWRKGIATLPVDEWIERSGRKARKAAKKVIAHVEAGGSEHDPQVSEPLAAVNAASEKLNHKVQQACAEQLATGRVVGLVGGDHSTPLGLMRALAASGSRFGILHIDAHADLRDAYEGFEYSHASIMRNALKIEGVEKLVQVGLRDFSRAEAEFAASESRVVWYTDRAWSAHKDYEGLVAQLPQEVYISFDIDGLERALCPSTGTPVPGGVSWHDALNLLDAVRRSGRRVVGFDLTEVTPGQEWDAIVGARLLYKLCLTTLDTHR